MLAGAFMTRRSTPPLDARAHTAAPTIQGPLWPWHHPLQDYDKLVEQLQQRGLHVEVAPVSRLDW